MLFFDEAVKKSNHKVVEFIGDLINLNYTEEICKKIANGNTLGSHLISVCADGDDSSNSSIGKKFKGKHIGLFVHIGNSGYGYCKEDSSFYCIDMDSSPCCSKISFSKIMAKAKEANEKRNNRRSSKKESADLEKELSRLNKTQEEFELFKAMCYTDVREMNMIHEGASEEELNVFKESRMEELTNRYPNLKEYLKNNF